MTDLFFAATVAARKQILAITPYLVPTGDIMRAFRTAALRGVDVRIVVPEKNNHVYAGMASRALYGELLLSGVRIFERPPPFVHAKAFIVDGEVSLIGTANLDVRSLRLNYETNLAVFDPAFADTLKPLILDDLGRSREISYMDWQSRPVHRQMLENFCTLFTPIL